MRAALIVVFLGIIGYALFQIWDTENNYVKEEKVRKQMELFKPAPPVLTDAEDNEETVVINQGVIDAQLLNPDVVGWITLEGTAIDYPFVQTEDNAFYLRRDIYGERAYAGTVFMDYRNAPDFSDFASILYGHSMNNGSMFADIKLYGNPEFFDENKTGWLYLPYATYKLDIFSFMVVKGDASIYAPGFMDELEKKQYLGYIKEYASQYREISINDSDKLIVLSTCSSTSQEMRRVVIAKLTKT